MQPPDPSPHQKLFRELRRHRERAGLSRKEIADIMEVTPSQIANLELGSSDTTVEKLCRFAAAVGRSVELVTTDTRDTPPVSEARRCLADLMVRIVLAVPEEALPELAEEAGRFSLSVPSRH